MTEARQTGPSLTVRAGWVMAAKTVSFMLSFALPLLLVRRLAQDEFGRYKQVFLLVDTAVAILPLGFYLSAFYFLPREPTRQMQVIFNILLFHLFVGGLACAALVLRPTLAAELLNAPELTRLATPLGLVILCWIISYFLETAAVAHQELRLAVIFIIGARLTKSGLLLAAALYLPTVKALLWTSVAQGVLQTVVLLYYLRSRFGPFWRGFEWAMMREQLSYALPLGCSAVVLALFATLDNYFVSHRFGSATYAVYAVGCFSIPLVPLLSEAVGQVMLPRVSLLQRQGQLREIVELTARMMRKLAFVYLPIYALLLVVAREFIEFLFTAQYAASWPIFAINLTLIPLGLLASAVDPVMRAFAAQRYYLLKARLVLLGLMVVAILVGLRLGGMVGAITAAVLVNFVERLVTTHRSARVLGVTRRDWPLVGDVGKIAIAAGISGVAAALVRGLWLAGAKPFVVLVACGSAFAFVYAAALLLLNVLTLAERDMLRARFNQLLRRTPRPRAAERLT